VNLLQQPLSEWPLTNSLELAALPTAVGCARKHARAVTVEFGLSTLADDVELIVSELATNSVLAVTHLGDASLTIPVIRLWLASDLHSVLIGVWDASSQMPARQEAGPDDESGRGLMLVGSLAKEWGTYREDHGKVTWALITLADS
jgi:anti-sigma regulatory factor (Ser/Thr protein kinase)